MTALIARQLDADDPDRPQAVHRILGLKTTHVAGLTPQAEAFFDALARRGLRANLLIGVYEGDCLRSASLAIESPGSMALVLTPPVEGVTTTDPAMQEAIRALRCEGQASTIRLLQALIEPTDATTSAALKGAGFEYLTKLLYLKGSVPPDCEDAGSIGSLEWEKYTGASKARFLSTLAETHVASLDCPGLERLRSKTEVLETHESASESGTDMWWLACRKGSPVGLILLADHPRTRTVEIVYMGVVASARGTGVGDMLLRFGLIQARKRSATTMALAVDRANHPARRLYARHGFDHDYARDVWVCSLNCDKRLTLPGTDVARGN